MPFNITWEPYSLFNATNSSTFHGMIEYANTTIGTYGMNFATMSSITIFIILLALFRKEGFEMALMGAGFITTLLTVMLWAMGLVPEYVFMAFAFLTATIVIISKK